MKLDVDGNPLGEEPKEIIVDGEISVIKDFIQGMVIIRFENDDFEYRLDSIDVEKLTKAFKLAEKLNWLKPAVEEV